MRSGMLLRAFVFLPLLSACQDDSERAPHRLPDARQAPSMLRFLDRTPPIGGSEPAPLIDQTVPGVTQDQQPVDRATHATVDRRLTSDQEMPRPVVDRGSSPRDMGPMRTPDRAMLGFPCAVSCDCLDGFSCINDRCQLGEGELFLFCCSGYCPAGERCESEAGQLGRCPD